ncbi:chemotaxis protein [Sulfurospirillum sp. T05]|uniref:Chemotaxis protein n=1 Tax=Sulfurospirillum tamanense TaxID=2813362 RepID=A0ABS2WT65_9BACT|nr:chemotaxis protein [Sulfurospirillum tamanensis]MBN2964848.1 chemotaxis protein [Sulfurospirillum tamanensis]
MTQEELDALMAGGLDEISEEAANDTPAEEEAAPEEELSEPEADPVEDFNASSYRISSSLSWPPPPPTQDHKMVHQLDDVTRDSEIKATEVFDKLEAISAALGEVQNEANEVTTTLDNTVALFATLIEKFPNVERFATALEEVAQAKEKMDNLVMNAQMAEDEIMMTMDIMQYQDIHRQKIERVINVMRALSHYMSSLFEGKIEDSKRVSSAVHIEGDSTTADVVTNEDIEALIDTLGKK